MADTTIKSFETRVLESLSGAPEPLDLDKVIERVRQADQDTRSVDVKIAALSLVSKGQIGLNEFWQLSAR